jgi:hypothetical protein
VFNHSSEGSWGCGRLAPSKFTQRLRAFDITNPAKLHGLPIDLRIFIEKLASLSWVRRRSEAYAKVTENRDFVKSWRNIGKAFCDAA